PRRRDQRDPAPHPRYREAVAVPDRLCVDHPAALFAERRLHRRRSQRHRARLGPVAEEHAMSLAGLDLPALDRHLHRIGVPRSGELRAELISGGRSNLTFDVRDDASAWVLRRPPMHGLTPSAHDMAREYRVVAGLADTQVPVAKAVTLCEDDS